MSRKGCPSPFFQFKSRTILGLQSKNLGVVIWAWSQMANVTLFSRSAPDVNHTVDGFLTIATVPSNKYFASDSHLPNSNEAGAS